MPYNLTIRTALGEVAAAALIVGAAWWAPWLYYIVTGRLLEF